MSDLLGPTVTVVRTLESGEQAAHTVPAALAMLLVYHDDELNGSEVVSARIEWGDVNARAWDMSI